MNQQFRFQSRWDGTIVTIYAWDEEEAWFFLELDVLDSIDDYILLT
jgi:hypothetical protein